MDSLRQFFSFLNDVSFPYVVLRNWDNLPEDYNLGEHSDLDILVYDYDHFFELFPKAEKVYALPRVRTRIPIGATFLYVDVRHVGDDYYPEEFENAILKTREWNERGFWTPDYIHHTLALAYHAVHHKNAIAPEYQRHLGPLSVDELLTALKASSVGWVEPKDRTVGRFHAYWKGATSVVEKRGVYFAKRQVGYLKYPLLKNEIDILSTMYKGAGAIHIPQGCYMDSDGCAMIQDCGEPLTAENLPTDWGKQLQEIISELKTYCIQHRDIKLDNLMVKDGTVYLIDFGWSVPTTPRGGEFEDIESNPPSCLGLPNKPSYGFDDEYSMSRVIRQIEYMKEESQVCA